MSNARVIAAAVAAGTLIVAHSSEARDPQQPAALSEMLACQQVTDAGQRLACFDRTVAALGAAAAKKDVVVVDRDQMRAARRSLFGFTVPNLAILGFGGNSGDETRELTSKVASASQTSDGHWQITLPDGAVWIQVDDNPPFHKPHPGSSVVIQKALLGTYFIKVDGQIGYRAVRKS